MVKMLKQGKDALSQRLEKIQFKTLRPLVWKALSYDQLHTDLTEMGLSTFFRTTFGEGDEHLCREFLRTYNKNHGTGLVRGQLILTDPKTVHLVLKLPHTSQPVKDVPKPTPEQLQAMYSGPIVKVPHNGYSTKALADPNFKEFVSFLVDRFSCKVNGAYVGCEILYAAKYLWDTKACLDWAGYLSQRIQGQCKRVRGTNQCSFEYTQYLTEIIRYQLGSAAANGILPPPEQHIVSENGIGLALAIIEPNEGGRLNGHLDDDGQEKKRRRSSGTVKNLTQDQSVESAYGMLGRAIEQQTRDFQTRLWEAENRVRELEAELRGTKAELREMNAKYQAEVQKQVEWEVQNNILQQEKQEQLQHLMAQQALRQRLEMESHAKV